MSDCHTRLERVRDRFDSAAQRSLGRCRPRSEPERDLISDVDTTLARWIAQAGPTEVAAILGARIGKLMPTRPVVSPRRAAEAVFAGRAEGDVPSAGDEP